MKRSEFMKYLATGFSSAVLLLGEWLRPAPAKPQTLRGIEVYRGGVAGHAYSNAHKIAQLKKGTPLELLTEPQNPHDADAIRVLAYGWRVGYLPAGENKPLARMMRQGVRLTGEVETYEYHKKKNERLNIRVWVEG